MSLAYRRLWFYIKNFKALNFLIEALKFSQGYFSSQGR